MANAIRTGNCRTNSLLVAHSFSIFNVPYIDAVNMGSYNKTELDLLQSEGEGIPKEMVKKLTENKFKCPTITHHLRHQFNNWYGVLQICFGKQALVSKEARAWITLVDQHESSYDACFKADPDFGVKVLGLVDITFFQLCENSLRAHTLDGVDFTAITLNKRYDILQNCFQANKPAYLTQPPKKMHGADGDEGDDAGKDGRKRLKSIKEGGGKFQDLGAMVQNGSQVAEWKLPTVKYKDIFTPETNAAPPPLQCHRHYYMQQVACPRILLRKM